MLGLRHLAKVNGTKKCVGSDYSILRDENEERYIFWHSKPNKTKVNAMHIRSILLPKESEMKMPEWILQDWAETIAYGAQSRCKLQVGKGWYDPHGAAESNRQFLSGMNQARILARKNYTNTANYLSIPIAPLHNRKGIFGLNGFGEPSVNV